MKLPAVTENDETAVTVELNVTGAVNVQGAVIVLVLVGVSTIVA